MGPASFPFGKSREVKRGDGHGRRHIEGFYVAAEGDGKSSGGLPPHRSRQFHCHSRCLFLSGTPTTSSVSCFLLEMRVGSPLPVREPTSFHIRRKQRWQGACPTLPFVTRRRRCGQMRGRRPEADPRFTFHASRFTVLGSGPSTTQMVADRSPQ